MNFKNRKDLIFIILAGFFVTNTIVAELIGGKLVNFFGIFTQSIGIILWPFVFLLTDLLNEYFGKDGVKKLTYITVGLIIYTFILLTIAIKIPAITGSPVNDTVFKTIFGQSQWIIIGSVIAFLVSQLVDVFVFNKVKDRTGSKHIWLRATFSTVISQLVDTFIVQFVAFVIPGYWTISTFLHNASWGYIFKLLVALALIPLIYLAHNLIDKYLSKKEG